MKRKLLTAILVGVLFLSSFGLVVAKQVECPNCDGVGTINCPICEGTGLVDSGSGTSCVNCSGTGTLTPRIWMRTMDAPYAQDGSTIVKTTFQNKEIVAVDATITASVANHNATTEVITFPPYEDVPVTIEVPYVSTYSGFSLMQHTTVKATDIPEITCPYCDGSGTVYSTKTCTQCHGVGTIECPDCQGTGYVDKAVADRINSGQSTSGLDLALIGGVSAAVAVAAGGGFAGFFLLKKRRVSEKSLRRLSAAEFQAWVIKRLDGKTAASMDTSMGINGYTSLNQPIQIRQSDGVGMNAVDLFASSVARKRASGGVMVAFSFADDAIRGKVRARRGLNLDIQMMTVAELIENRRPY